MLIGEVTIPHRDLPASAASSPAFGKCIGAMSEGGDHLIWTIVLMQIVKK